MGVMPSTHKVNCNNIVRNKTNEVVFMPQCIYSKLYLGHKTVMKITSHINGGGIYIQLTQKGFSFSVTKMNFSFQLLEQLQKIFLFQKVSTPSSLDHESESNISSETEQEFISFEYNVDCFPPVFPFVCPFRQAQTV